MTLRTIAVDRTFEVASVRTRFVPYDWPFAHDEDGAIERRWAELRRHKPGLFDGRVLMSRDLAESGDALVGLSFAVRYKPFLCWREFGYPGEPVKNLFAMPALRSADGAFLMGRMAAGTANAGLLYFPAGTPEPADVGADGFVDYDANILRELEEETGIAPQEVSLAPRWTIVCAGPLVACMKVVQSPLPASALVERVAEVLATQADAELDELVAIAGPRDFDAATMPAYILHYLAAQFGAAATGG